MILIPYRLKTSYSRFPISNAAIIGLTTVSYIFTEFNLYPLELVKGMVRAEIQPEKLIPKKSSGWIRLTAPGDQPLSGVKLKLSFDGGPGGRVQKDLASRRLKRSSR